MSLDTPISPLFSDSKAPAATHIVYLALGSNLGDRRGNLAAALQQLREIVTIETVSSVYETKPVGYLEQPRFLNIACCGKTWLSAQDLLQYTQAIEVAIGRQPTFRNGPRPIDIDILLYDDLHIQDEHLTIPHPRMTERAFVLAPLAEISPNVIEPVSGQTAQELLQQISQEGITRLAPNLRITLDRDIQNGIPGVRVRLGRAGVVGVRKSLLIGDEGHQQWFDATFDLYADLNTQQAGVHMSRFSDVLEEVLEENASSTWPRIEI
ncbi:MAG: 2-amino-4-hydroxy-6-hydroxymethyldihydropteridine diphosphokinase, partial [Ktedonobacteraceae bacterium]|nr:2-amino-4-hydroxy-6-hydroxymethyldihydropteridine diphosphokinase [Ktedonobacteraceae bacterium]